MNEPSPIVELPTELPTTILERLAFLEDALKKQNPAYEGALSFLHSETAKHSEYVYMLTDQQIRTIVQGYEQYAKITIDIGNKKITSKQGALLGLEDV